MSEFCKRHSPVRTTRGEKCKRCGATRSIQRITGSVQTGLRFHFYAWKLPNKRAEKGGPES